MSWLKLRAVSRRLPNLPSAANYSRHLVAVPDGAISSSLYPFTSPRSFTRSAFPKRQPYSRHGISNVPGSRYFSTASPVLAENDGSDSDTEERPLATNSFDDLESLHPRTLKAVQHLQLNQMTDIQAQSWDAIVDGQDVLGRSRTGSGKTLAFFLPALERLLANEKSHSYNKDNLGIRMLILSPTRELSHQIHNTVQSVIQHHSKDVTSNVWFGGVPKGGDLKRLQHRIPTILTATPGRLLDHLENSYLHQGRNDVPVADLFENVEILVLDEMDRLLEIGFRRDIQRILRFLPSKQTRQTLLFSATLPPTVQEAIRESLQKNYVTVDCVEDDDPTSHTVQTVQQSHVLLPKDKMIWGILELVETLRQEHYQQQQDMQSSSSSKNANEGGGGCKIMIFCNTTSHVSLLAHILKETGFPRVLELQSKMSQAARTQTSDRFRNARSAILVTSDVSARGVDYPHVTHVLQLGSATDRETYIHRLGRTARAGRSGRGILVLMCPEEAPAVSKELKGLDIPLDDKLQGVLDNGVDNTSFSMSEQEARFNDTLVNRKTQQLAVDCYKSFLGFYFQRLRAIGGTRDDDVRHTVVDLINTFADQANLRERPALARKLVDQMGLSFHPGITVATRRSNNSSRYGEGDFNGGRGDGRRGRGGGRWDRQYDDYDNDNYHSRGKRNSSRGRSRNRYDNRDGRNRNDW